MFTKEETLYACFERRTRKKCSNDQQRHYNTKKNVKTFCPFLLENYKKNPLVHGYVATSDIVAHYSEVLTMLHLVPHIFFFPVSCRKLGSRGTLSINPPKRIRSVSYLKKVCTSPSLYIQKISSILLFFFNPFNF